MYRNHKGSIMGISKQTNIEKSSNLKNVKIFDELESKQEFFQMSKESRKIYENEADAKFL